MSTLGDRVKAVIVHNKTTMTKFAKELNISQSMVSKICANKANPSDRTISDICRIYNINRTWLVDGVGDMCYSQTVYEVVSSAFAKRADYDLYNSFYDEFAVMIARLTPLEVRMTLDFLSHIKDFRDKSESSALFDVGYREGLRARQRIVEMLDDLPTPPEE